MNINAKSPNLKLLRNEKAFFKLIFDENEADELLSQCNKMRSLLLIQLKEKKFLEATEMQRDLILKMLLLFRDNPRNFKDYLFDLVDEYMETCSDANILVDTQFLGFIRRTMEEKGEFSRSPPRPGSAGLVENEYGSEPQDASAEALIQKCNNLRDEGFKFLKMKNFTSASSTYKELALTLFILFHQKPNEFTSHLMTTVKDYFWICSQGGFQPDEQVLELNRTVAYHLTEGDHAPNLSKDDIKEIKRECKSIWHHAVRARSEGKINEARLLHEKRVEMFTPLAQQDFRRFFPYLAQAIDEYIKLCQEQQQDVDSPIVDHACVTIQILGHANQQKNGIFSSIKSIFSR